MGNTPGNEYFTDTEEDVYCPYCNEHLKYWLLGGSLTKAIYGHYESCPVYWKDKYNGSLKWNCGDWTTLETVEIGDTVAGVKVDSAEKRDFLRVTGEILGAM